MVNFQLLFFYVVLASEKSMQNEEKQILVQLPWCQKIFRGHYQRLTFNLYYFSWNLSHYYTMQFGKKLLSEITKDFFVVKTPWYQKIFKGRHRSLKFILFYFFCFPLSIIFLFTTRNTLVTLRLFCHTRRLSDRLYYWYF